MKQKIKKRLEELQPTLDEIHRKAEVRRQKLKLWRTPYLLEYKQGQFRRAGEAGQRLAPEGLRRRLDAIRQKMEEM